MDAVTETKISQAIEQLRDIIQGEETYDSFDEWADNVKAAYKDLEKVWEER